MILASLLTLFSLHPWNVETSGYLTYGDYSQGGQYKSYSLVLTMDRVHKEYFTLGLEHLLIKSKFDDYHQDNIFFKGGYEVKPSFKPSFIAGRIQSNIWDEGWSNGVMIEGDVILLGYFCGYFFSEMESFDPGTSFIRTNESTQWEFGLSRQFGSHNLSVSTKTTRYNEQATIAFNTFRYEWDPGELVNFSATYGLGQAHLLVDHNVLSIDNKPEKLTQMAKVKTQLRLTPNFYVHGAFSFRKYYEQEDVDEFGIGRPEIDYSVKYYTLGLSLRI